MSKKFLKLHNRTTDNMVFINFNAIDIIVFTVKEDKTHKLEIRYNTTSIQTTVLTLSYGDAKSLQSVLESQDIQIEEELGFHQL